MNKKKLPFLSGFLRAVSVLAGGTAIAQVIALTVLPLLTRLFNPDDFGILAIYSSVVGLFSVIACMRFEIAIPIPLKDNEAANLLILSLAASIFSSLFALAVSLAFALLSNDHSNQEFFIKNYWLIPLGILFSSTGMALQYWASRKKRYSSIANVRISQSVGGSGFQLICGAIAFAPTGLIIGQILNAAAGIPIFVKKMASDDIKHFLFVTRKSLIRTFKKYDRFPKFSVSEALANSAGIQIPILIIAAVSETSEVGFIALASRIMLAPMTLVGGAVSQVYLSQAPTELRNGNLNYFTLKIIGGLLKSGVGPLFFIGVIAPVIFPIVFGQHWGRVGNFALWMTPWIIVQFLTSPISTLLHITRNQKIAVQLQVYGMVFRIGAVVFAALWLPGLAFEAYVISGVCFYVVYFIVLMKICNINTEMLKKEIQSSVFWPICWMLASLIFAFLSTIIFQYKA